MFRPKLLMPVLNGFTTMDRYTRAVGCTTQVNTPLLKVHTTRFTGSSGSGTDSGRTTFSAWSLETTDFVARRLETDPDCVAQPTITQHANATVCTMPFKLSHLHTFSLSRAPC